MPQVKLKPVSTKSLAKAIKECCEEAGKVTAEMLDEVMDRALDKAYELYDEAMYAGVAPLDEVEPYIEETGPLSRELIAEGDIVEFIEYGTGVEGPSSDGKSFWFFNEDGRNIVENDFVEHAEPRMRYFNYAQDELGRFREELDEPELDEREGVWFTRGNPPNDIMTQLADYIREITPEVFEEMK